MGKTNYKIYIYDGIYDKNDVNFTLFDAEKGYTLIYSDEAPTEAGFFEVTSNVLDAREKQWLLKCQREIMLTEFYDFSEVFFDQLLDNFERELEVEKQKQEKLDKKEKKKWRKMQRVRERELRRSKK